MCYLGMLYMKQRKSVEKGMMYTIQDNGYLLEGVRGWNRRKAKRQVKEIVNKVICIHYSIINQWMNESQKLSNDDSGSWTKNLINTMLYSWIHNEGKREKGRKRKRKRKRQGGKKWDRKQKRREGKNGVWRKEESSVLP